MVSVEWGILTYTMHPYVIGRGHRMLALEDFVDRLAQEGAVFMAMEDAAREGSARLWGGPDTFLRRWSFRGALLREPGIQAAVPLRSGFRVQCCALPRNDGIVWLAPAPRS